MSENAFRDAAIHEIISSDFEREEVFAFMSALAKEAGLLNIVRKRMNLVLYVDSYDEAMFAVSVLKKIYPTEFEIAADEIKSGSKRGERAYSVSVPSGFTMQALEDFGLVSSDGFDGFEAEVPKKFLHTHSFCVAYLKGLFLACGAVYVPSLDEDDSKKGYHFEFRLDEEERAQSVANLLGELGVNAKTSERGSIFLVYIKDKDEILKLLGILGLSECSMQLQRVIDEKETANSLNRVIICETANLDKTYAAASKQLLAIGTIADREGLESLPPALFDTARARMEYQQASLQELADILGISKSCLNHRLRKIVELAEEAE